MAHIQRLRARKEPTQRRAQETVDSILRAAAHVLRKDGIEGATTNRIAEKAGVSIGSLYQYFPSKEAILSALLEAHVREIDHKLAAVMGQTAEQTLEESVRVFIRAMLDAHSADPLLHRVLSDHVHNLGGMDRVRELLAPGTAMVRAYLGLRAGDVRKVNLDVATFILVNAVEAVTHAFFTAEPDFDVSALEEEVCGLIVRYLRPE